MQLTSFRVKGFKNFTEEVRLRELGAINVIHGGNNVGKSNLLQAMQLFFLALDWIDHSRGPETLKLSDADFEKAGLVRSELFNLYQPRMPIVLSAEISLDDAEVERARLDKEMQQTGEIEIELQWQGTHVDFRISRFLIAGGKDARNRDLWSWALGLAKELSRTYLIQESPQRRFAYIPALRPIDDELALELYDAKESTEAEHVQRWERFVEAMKSFSDILGEGSFVAIYERKEGRANLAFHTEGPRILLNLMGSAVQQVVNLIGHLLMTNASIVAIEEPELNLKYDLQERLHEALVGIVGSPGGPSQLFLTSHSPAFESGPYFYFMKAGPQGQGPVVERLERAKAMAAVGFPAEVTNLPQHATLSYVSTDGVVRLHPSVLEALGLPNGGGVMFVDGDRTVEMMSDERYIERLGLGGSDEGED